MKKFIWKQINQWISEKRNKWINEWVHEGMIKCNWNHLQFRHVEQKLTCFD